MQHKRKNSGEADQKERSVCNLSGNTDTAAYVDEHHQLALHLPITTRQSHLVSLTFFRYSTLLYYTKLHCYTILYYIFALSPYPSCSSLSSTLLISLPALLGPSRHG